jgi:phage shock protein A
MKHQRHFDTSEAAQREAAQIKKMIGDLDRSVQLLNADIAAEEERTRISDRSDIAYPILARMLAIRRDNLEDTITALERRLSKLDQAEMVAELA